MIADASLVLWSPYCDAMLHAVDDTIDGGALDPRLVKVLTNVLTTVHVSADRAGVDDALLRGRIALRLILLLEQDEQLRDAVQMARHAVQLVYEARSQRWNTPSIAPSGVKDIDALTMSSVTTTIDEEMRVSAAQRVGGNAFGIASTLEPLDQDLAVLHTDLLLALFRTELALGSKNYQATLKHRARAILLKERELAKNQAEAARGSPQSAKRLSERRKKTRKRTRGCWTTRRTTALARGKSICRSRSRPRLGLAANAKRTTTSAHFC